MLHQPSAPTCRWWASGGEGKRSPIPKRDGMESFSPRCYCRMEPPRSGARGAAWQCHTVTLWYPQHYKGTDSVLPRRRAAIRPAAPLYASALPNSRLVIYGVVTRTQSSRLSETQATRNHLGRIQCGGTRGAEGKHNDMSNPLHEAQGLATMKLDVPAVSTTPVPSCENWRSHMTTLQA